MNRSKLTLALAAGLVTTALASAQSSYTAVSGAFIVQDVTPDGSIVVGSGGGGGFYWDWKTDPSPTFIGGLSATGVSDDGSAICGNITDPMTGAEIAGRWTLPTGWVSIGALPNAMQCPSLSSAYDISGDGETIVGLSWDGCSGRGFIWTLGVGMSQLENLINGTNRATAIARDGSLIGGFAQASTRTPVTWVPAGTGTVYDMTVGGEVYNCSDDGDRIVGQWNGQGFYMDNPSPATMPVLIPGAVSGWNGQATDTNEVGDRIIGFDSFLLDSAGWVHDTTTNTTTTLLDALTNAGVPNLPFNIGPAIACSADGTVIVGRTQFGDAWIIELAGCNAGSSSFCSPSPNSVDATGAVMSSNGDFSISSNNFILSAGPVPNQPGIFYFGADQLNGGNGVPFGDGLRCVGGSTVYRLPVANGIGNQLNYAVDFSSPPASDQITPGSTWNFQAWYRDPAAGGATFNLSDGLEVTFCE